MQHSDSDGFYGSMAWKNAREAYKRQKGYLCEECKSHGLTVPGTVVHHIIPLTADNIDNPEITLSFNNMRLLCDACHRYVHREKSEGGNQYYFDAFGNIISL